VPGVPFVVVEEGQDRRSDLREQVGRDPHERCDLVESLCGAQRGHGREPLYLGDLAPDLNEISFRVEMNDDLRAEDRYPVVRLLEPHEAGVREGFDLTVDEAEGGCGSGSCGFCKAPDWLTRVPREDAPEVLSGSGLVVIERG